MTRTGLCAGVCALLAVLLLATGAKTGGVPTPQIVNGEETQAFETTAAILEGSNPLTAFVGCTGTLIGCDTVLTAAHCVCDSDGPGCQGAGAPDPNDFIVFLQHSGFHTLDDVIVQPGYDFPIADLAILRLSTPVDGIKPTPLNVTASPLFGTAGTIAGFGQTQGDPNAPNDWGIKRAGSVTTAECPADPDFATSVCWNFEAPLGPPGSNSNTCNADSGGPLFISNGSGDELAGVTSGGIATNCLEPDTSYDTDVYMYDAWIAANSGTLGQSSCGGLPQIGDPAVAVDAFSGDLDAGTPTATHQVIVPPAVPAFKVTLNGKDDGVADFDLYVKFGSPPTTSDHDCFQANSGQFGECSFASPAAGTWHILIDRFAGAGRYQSTATTFAIQPIPLFPYTNP